MDFARLAQKALIIGANIVLSHHEPPPIRYFKLVLSNHKRALAAIAKAKHNDFVRFDKPVSRTAMLSAAYSYLRRHQQHEEAIVALGKQHGRGARFEGFWLGVGDRHSVSLSPAVIQAIEQHMQLDGGEIIMIHNHGENPIKSLLASLIDWRPVPSGGDRDIATAFNAAACHQYALFQKSTRFGWYLVDRERIAEFMFPSVDRFVTYLLARG